MPLRCFNREQGWLFPPTVEELLPADHPARFVAAFLDMLEPKVVWALEGGPGGDPMGAPAYHPHALLSIWVYGFMSGVRSSRKLEAACRDQIPFLWISGNQRPDHNTLWRYYEAHREGMRALLKGTVQVAVRAGLVDLALQAVDGTKVGANARGERTLDAQGLQGLLERTEKVIRGLEAENVSGGEASAVRLPKGLEDQQALRAEVKEALERVQAEGGPTWVNLTDPDAGLLKGAGARGFLTGYNAQAMVSPLVLEGEPRGMLITAAEVVAEGDDHPQLQAMMAQAAEHLGSRAGVTTLADAGYYSGANLQATQGEQVLLAEPQERKRRDP
jgi:transposase